MRRILFVVFVAVTLGIICGCSKLEGIHREEEKREKISFNLNFTIVPQLVKSVDENIIHNANIYIADGSGAVITHKYKSSWDNTPIESEIYKNLEYSVYVIANAGKKLEARSVSEIEGLEHLVNSPEEITERGTGVLMSGETGPLKLRGGESVSIGLERGIAKIKFRADFSGLDSDVKIAIKRIELKNAPKRIRIFGKSKINSVEDAMSGGILEIPQGGEIGDDAIFYMYENMQGDLLPGNSEQMGKIWPQGSYYSRVCSYIEITAEYLSDIKEGEVTYRFYLGRDMVKNFDIERNTEITVTVSFNGRGSLDENTWRVDTSQLTDVIVPEISFALGSMVLYDLEYANIPYSIFYPHNAEATVTSSNPDIVRIIGNNSSGVQVQGRETGEAIITSRIGDKAVTECKVRVEKLSITPVEGAITLYNHFYYDIPYSITPVHASSLGVKVRSNTAEISTGYNSVANRIIPQFNAGASFPFEEELSIEIAGREDVNAKVKVKVMPILSITPQIQVIANKGNKSINKNMGIECSPRANVKLEWVERDNISIYGDPGENVKISTDENIATFPIPNGANGLYRLKASVIGDDGYGTSEVIHTDAVKYCDITIYETIYLVGISKTMNRTKISTNPDIWEYENEIVAKWFTHPNSLLFPQGEVDLGLKYIYDGVEYEDSHTEKMESIEFTFEMGETIEYALDGGSKEYKGTPPRYYLEYFYLQSSSSSLIRGDLLTGTPYLHIYSRPFMSGFSDEATPDWSKIFEYIYGY